MYTLEGVSSVANPITALLRNTFLNNSVIKTIPFVCISRDDQK